MKYWYQKPNDVLRDQIKTVLILEGFSEAVPSKLPLVTTGMPVFLCKVGTGEMDRPFIHLSLIAGNAPKDCWEVDKTTTIIAWFFNPFVIAALFNLEATILKERMVELHEWNAHKTNALKIQLAHADTTDQKLQVLEHLLLEQLKQQKVECELIQKATDEMLIQTDAGVIRELLKDLDINPRTFQRLFKKYVGVTPTQYRRICQFQLSFAQVRAREFSKLSDVAYENGFADQSHFIRSFKEFTQTTPNDYLRSGLKKS